MDYICRRCGKTIDAVFANHWNCCSSLTGCGSKDIWPKNEFDDLNPVYLAEALEDLQTRLSELERAFTRHRNLVANP